MPNPHLEKKMLVVFFFFSLAILASPNGRLVKSSARIPPSKKVKADSEALEEALEEILFSCRVSDVLVDNLQQLFVAAGLLL